MTDLAINIYSRIIRQDGAKDKFEVLIGDLVLEALSPMHAHTLMHQLKTSIDTHTTAGATIIPTGELKGKT